MRIGIITPYYRPAYIYGGPARSIPAMCEGLAQAGAEVNVFTTNACGSSVLDVPTVQPINVDGVIVNYYKRSNLLPLRYFYSPDLGRACHDQIQQFDIVYLCGTWTYPFLACSSSCRRATVPYVISPRGSFMAWSMEQKKLKKRIYLELVERRYLDEAAVLHCTSKLELDQMKRWNFCPPIRLIPNGIDLTPFRALPQRGKLRMLLAIPDSAPVALFSGRLHKEKRLDRIIGAFSHVLAEIADAHLVIMGQEEDGSGMLAKKLAIDLGISDSVHFTGMLTDVDLTQAYADADILVLLSRRENFGMSAVEGMAAGLPLLLSSDVGIGDHVKREKAGFVVPGDSFEVEKAWIFLLRSAQLRSEMARAGLNLAFNYYSSEAVAKQMLGLFQEVANNHIPISE